MTAWLRLLILALRGRVTYIPDFNCGCDECITGRVEGFRSRFNQPPFVWDPVDRDCWSQDPQHYFDSLPR